MIAVFRHWAMLIVATALVFSPLVFADNQSKIADISVRDYGVLPEISMMAISPSGNRIAYRTTKDGRDIAVVFSLSEKRLLGSVDLREITPQSIYFATDNELVLVASEVRRLFGYRDKLALSTAYAYSLVTKEVRQLLTPGDVIYPGQHGLGRIAGLSPDRKYVYMPAYVPDDRHDHTPRMSLVEVEFDSPQRPRVHFKGLESSIDFFLDGAGEVIAHELFDNRRNLHRILARHGDDWKEIYRKEIDMMEISVVGLNPDRESLVFLAENSETGRDDYFIMDLVTGEVSDAGLGRSDADVEATFTSHDRVVWGVRYSGFNPSYKFFDEDLDRRMAEIQSVFPEHSVWLRDWSDNWEDLLVYVEGSSEAGSFYRFSKGQQPAYIATARPKITAQHIHPIGRMRFQASDGLIIPNLLTIPRSKVGAMKNLPAVVMPHGGPASYDHVGFDWLAQALANRGYLVVQPQFRGSFGFGRDHYEAGHGEWGGKMQEDLTDAVKVLVKKGVVDPERICIVGASYGGYAALAGGAFTPDLYRCVVSINGIGNLEDMLKDKGRLFGDDHWLVAYWQENIGNGKVSQDHLRKVSPALFVDNFSAPVLLIHGEDDLTVPISQSENMYKKLKQAKKTVELMKLEEETHYLVGNETRLQTVESVVAFVDKYLQPTSH
ncbi:alpha/beta hydrolase family protein [Microbulbifer aggregans]|uniref:alpha/beta hydrolase family protein n=1 Tax=Microbulbifer aggregans TaxID=1769779 RepID=UPI001CFE2916|nr:alpha/beta fold hydrolase [Microbulbifer aggregans]